jgi:hypothetical protein
MRLGYRLGGGTVTKAEIDAYADERELERLRRTLRRELAIHRGQEALAGEIGVSRIVLRKFVAYQAVPRPEHLQKIREWAEDRPPVWTPFGAVLLAAIVRGLPARERAWALSCLAHVLADGFRRAGTSVPPWLMEEAATGRASRQEHGHGDPRPRTGEGGHRGP